MKGVGLGEDRAIWHPGVLAEWVHFSMACVKGRSGRCKPLLIEAKSCYYVCFLLRSSIMFDFLAKLFSTYDSKTPKTSSKTSSSQRPAISAPDEEAQGKDKKILEQERQVWRQKLDAAAQNESVVLELLFSCDHAEGRLHAAQYLQSVSALEKTKLHFKKSDQRIVKIVQARLDQIKQKDRIIRAGQACISQAQALLTAEVVLPNQLAQLDQARRNLDQMGEVPQDVVNTFEPLRQQLDTRMREQVLLQRSLIDLVAQLKTLLATESALIADVWNDLKLGVEKLSQASAASSLPKKLLRESEELIARGDAKLLQQESDPIPQQEATTAEAAIQSESKMVASQVEDTSQASPESADAKAEIKQVSKQQFALEQKAFVAALEGLEEALREGRSQQARQFEKDLHELDLNHAPAYVNKHLRQRLVVARKEFAHLMSWARWSGVASREELVNTAEGLAQLRLSPKEIVDTVAALRAQWKQIEEAGGAGSKELWSRFDAACSAAYAPAGVHFQEQAQTRRDNGAKARELLVQIAEKVNVLLKDALDWREVANTLAQIRQDWRRIGMMDRKEKLALDRELDAILEPVEQALRAERELAQQDRRTLIAEAQKIEASQRDAVDAVRQLQQRWQQSAARVPLERSQEQELWLAFRAACDEVFAAKKAQHESAEQERVLHLQQKLAICAAMESVLAQAEVSRDDLVSH
ncbi:MAG: DUF349 domain-containing protein, partial [Burkholderiaceae bacterium]